MFQSSITQESPLSKSLNPLELLVQAAAYVDRCDRDKEHGYAAPAYQIGNEPMKSKLKVIRRAQNRTSHNELEKNRRAHLRSCLEKLKSIVPLRQDATRHTTLGLLNQARTLIKSLEEKRYYFNMEKDELNKQNTMLKRKLLQLEMSRRRRNSTGSAWSSGHSESSNDSDKDEEIIDVMDCSDEPDLLRASVSVRSPNLITISVPKALTLPPRSAGIQATTKVNKSALL